MTNKELQEELKKYDEYQQIRIGYELAEILYLCEEKECEDTFVAIIFNK